MTSIPGIMCPEPFALKFMNFIKLVNGTEGEQNKTPVVHLAMLDRIAGKKERIANLCARGMAKTTLMFEYLILYIAVFGEIDGFGKLESMIYVSDSMDNGVKSARKNIEFPLQQFRIFAGMAALRQVHGQLYRVPVEGGKPPRLQDVWCQDGYPRHEDLR